MPDVSNAYAMFRCCVTNRSLQEYEEASDAVLAALGIPVVEIKEFGCCGYPLRNVDYTASMYSAARNFALAERAGKKLLTVCNCCYGSLKQARNMLARDEDLAQEVADKLQGEALTPAPNMEDVGVTHLLELLHREVGVEALAAKVSHSLEGLQVVMHYGCHVLRPSKVLQFDNPWNPSICEDLVATTGAQCLDWDKRLDCCGAPLAGVFDDLSQTMAEQKLVAAQDAGAHCLLVVCPYCHMQLARTRQTMVDRGQACPPIVLITQLLASALGVGQDLNILANTVS